MNGRSQMQGGKSGFCPNVSSESLIGWKSVKKHLYSSMGPDGGCVAIWTPEIIKGFYGAQKKD